MRVETEIIAVTTTGTAGSATGTANSRVINGLLLDVYLDYHASAPATTDVTIEYAEGDDILLVSNSATDARIAPRQKPVDNANAAITNGNDKFPLAGEITVSVAQSNALAPAVTVILRYLTD